MRILTDTNIFIYREDDRPVPHNLQLLLKTLSDLAVQITIHPLSIQEIKRDKDEARKRVVLSKIATYPVISNPPSPDNDECFISMVGKPTNVHDVVDNSLLYCIHRNAVDFLLTEDAGIQRKADRLGVSDRVFALDEAAEFFRKQLVVETIPKPPALQYVPVHNLDLGDPIFSSLKANYLDFTHWWDKLSREGRKAWTYTVEGRLGAILIYKIENEAIPSNPPLPRSRRLKICTFKVSYTGHKIGELFIKIFSEFALRNDLGEIYLTHFPEAKDQLAELVSDFGFYNAAQLGREDVLVKRMWPDQSRAKLDPLEICRAFYPCFCDGERVRKFVVPMRPEYHDRLFTDYQPRQLSLLESSGGLIIEGNTIKKAYLCHAQTKKMSNGDLLLFYRSQDQRAITSLGVLEAMYDAITDPDEIVRLVGKRSVYSKQEIEEIAKRPTKVMLFRQVCHPANRITIRYLVQSGVLHGAPQSIVGIDHGSYLTIKEYGGFDERLAVD